MVELSARQRVRGRCPANLQPDLKLLADLANDLLAGALDSLDDLLALLDGSVVCLAGLVDDRVLGLGALLDNNVGRGGGLGRALRHILNRQVGRGVLLEELDEALQRAVARVVDPLVRAGRPELKRREALDLERLKRRDVVLGRVKLGNQDRVDVGVFVAERVPDRLELLAVAAPGGKKLDKDVLVLAVLPNDLLVLVGCEVPDRLVLDLLDLGRLDVGRDVAGEVLLNKRLDVGGVDGRLERVLGLERQVLDDEARP